MTSPDSGTTGSSEILEITDLAGGSDTLPPSSGERDLLPDEIGNGLSTFQLQIAQNREAFPDYRSVVVVSDLDDLASGQVAASIREQGPRGGDFQVAEFNGVRPYNLISAAHTLAALLSDKKNFPAGSVFVIVVDPHVGQNGDDGQNVADKRAIVEYEDGTILVGPTRSYMRVGEHQGRGKIARAVEIDKDNLVKLGLTENKGNDVFDGLRRFGPAAAAALHSIPLEELGPPIDVEQIPALEIPEGTISDIEPNYENIRIETAFDRFPIGANLSVKDTHGKLLCIAKRRQAFEGEKGDIVAVNGSKFLIKDDGEGKKGLYLGAVEGQLASVLSEKYGKNVEVGDTLIVDVATEEEIAQYEGGKRLIELKEAAKDVVGAIGSKIEAQVSSLLCEQKGIGDVVSGVSNSLRKVAQWLKS
jgi:S-adenosylmethionine hydrolase